MNIIKKKILGLICSQDRGVRIKDMMNKIPELKKIDVNLKVNSLGYKRLVRALKTLRDYGYVKKIRYDGKKMNDGNGEVYWILTDGSKKHHLKWFKEQGII